MIDSAILCVHMDDERIIISLEKNEYNLRVLIYFISHLTNRWPGTTGHISYGGEELTKEKIQEVLAGVKR